MVQSAAHTKLTVFSVALAVVFQCNNMSSSRSRRTRDEVDADAGDDEMAICVKVDSI